jgi:hypothetical protein
VSENAVDGECCMHGRGKKKVKTEVFLVQSMKACRGIRGVDFYF